jgi:hypothetical protein
LHLRIVISHKWTFVAPCAENRDCDLLTFLENVGQRYEKDAAGLLYKMERVAQSELGTAILNVDICHKIDDKIYQLSHGSLRMLFFYSANKRKFIVCATAYIKKGKKTPEKIKNEAKRIESLYTEAEQSGKVTIVPDQEG